MHLTINLINDYTIYDSEISNKVDSFRINNSHKY